MQNKGYNLVFEPAFSASKAHTFSITPQSMFLKVNWGHIGLQPLI